MRLGEGTPLQRTRPAPSPLAGEGWGEGDSIEQFSWLAVEAFLKAGPALRIILLKRLQFRGIAREVLRKPGLEHESQVVGQLDRAKIGGVAARI